MKYDLNDYMIVPAVISDIKSRAEVNPYNELGILPIMTAPMFSVLSPTLKYNPDYIQQLLNERVEVVLPRGFENRQWKYNSLVWTSYSLDELKERIKQYKVFRINDSFKKVLIDIANGNMSELVETIKLYKSLCPKVILMVGNIANPLTYKVLSDAGADYIRLSVGGGGNCLTANHTAIHYPMASLIEECYALSKEIKSPAKLVADGGFKNYGDIIKALALGADYCMLGNIFSKTVESDNQSYLFNIIPIPYSLSKLLWKYLPVYKKHWGMSTKKVQRLWKKSVIKTSEGRETSNRVSYTLSGWIENLRDYMKSSMSYTNSKTLEQFKTSEKIIISQHASSRINK